MVNDYYKLTINN